MAFPAVIVEIEFGAWTDVTDYVNTISGTLRGRAYELDRTQTGSIQLDLDNADGRFTCGKTTSPYYPYIRASRRIRVRGLNMTSLNIARTGGQSHAADEFFLAPSNVQAVGLPSAVVHNPATLGFTGDLLNETYHIQSVLASGATSGAHRVLAWYAAVDRSVAMTHSAYVWKMSGTEPSGVTGTLTIRHFDATGTQVGSASSASWPIQTPSTPTRRSVTSTAPATTVTSQLSVEISPTGTTGVALTYAVAGVQSERGSSATVWQRPIQVFTGRVERWPIRMTSSLSTVTIVANDRMKDLGMMTLGSTLRETIAVEAGTKLVIPCADNPTDSKGKLTMYGPWADNAHAASTTLGVTYPPPSITAGYAQGVTGPTSETAINLAPDTTIKGVFIPVPWSADYGIAIGPLGTKWGYVEPGYGFTIECWFKRTAVAGSDWECLVSQQTQSPMSWIPPPFNGQQMFFGLTGTSAGIPNRLGLTMASEDSTNLITWADGGGGGYESDGNWHHAVVRMQADNRTVGVFLDGVQILADTLTSAMTFWSAGEMSFGGVYAPNLGNGGSNLWNGALAFLTVTEGPLSANRIAEHYTAGAGGTVYYGDDEVKRLTRILDWSKVPADARALDAPVTTLQGVKVADANALTLATDTAAGTLGLLFADGAGRIVYQNRRRRYNRWVATTLSEALGAAPEATMEWVSDDAQIYNDVRGTRPYGGSARIQSAVSQADHGVLVYAMDYPLTSDEELRNTVGWLAARYSTDRIRVSGVVLKAESSAVIGALVGGLQIGDRVAFDALPANAPTAHMEYIVEAVAVTASFQEETWSIGLELSPAELYGVFELAVSTVGDGSYLAF